MSMMNAGMLPEGGGGGIPMGAGAPGAAPPPDADDQGGLVTCPQCGAQFSPADAGNAAALAGAAGAGAGAGGPMDAAAASGAAPPESPPSTESADLATAAAPPVVGAGETCPECGGKMAGGTCSSCGYSKSHSPMREAISKHIEGQPASNRPDKEQVYKQGVRTRERMRRPAPYGRA